jgi:thiosulfate/3-mercaptopyruvate sulfurtransferase
MRDVASPFPYMLCSEKTFSDYLKLHSIKNSSRVVLYDQKPGQNFWATRVYWMFRAFGFKNVSVLDGGLSKWVGDGRATHSDSEAGSEDDYKVKFDDSICRNYI